MCDIDKEMQHIDALVICYRPRRGLPQMPDNGKTLEDHVKSCYDDTFGHLDIFVKSIKVYRGGNGLEITFKMPMAKEGQKAVIAAINTFLP